MLARLASRIAWAAVMATAAVCRALGRAVFPAGPVVRSGGQVGGCGNSKGRLRVLPITLLLAPFGAVVPLIVPTAASANWNQPVASELNFAPGSEAFFGGAASIGGVPYVAWHEPNGTANQIRVKRLVGGAWAA